MLDEILYEIGKLKWVIIISVSLILFFSIIFWAFSRKFDFSKKSLKVFSSLFKINKRGVISVGLIIGRLLFVITSSIFCSDINVGYLIILVFFTILIFVFSKNLTLFVSSILNFIIVFLLLFIESTLFNYYRTIEQFWLVIFMAFMIGIFVVADGILTSINAFQQIVRDNETA